MNIIYQREKERSETHQQLVSIKAEYHKVECIYLNLKEIGSIEELEVRT